MDLMDDQIEVFNDKIEKLRIPLKVLKASWKEIHKYYAKNSYDLLLCRGNSFIYADGGWNKKIEVVPKRALESYSITLKEFYNILKPGGFLYIDKFYDNEKPQKNPDIEGTAEKIEKSIGEKAFIIDRKKESALQRKELHPDINGTAEKIVDTQGQV